MYEIKITPHIDGKEGDSATVSFSTAPTPPPVPIATEDVHDNRARLVYPIFLNIGMQINEYRSNFNMIYILGDIAWISNNLFN